MESTAFNEAAWNPLHLIGMHFTMLHGMYCIQSRCMEFTAFNWDPLHNDASNPLRSMKIHCTTLHGIHCILSRSIGPRCIESTAFNRDPFITLHGIHWVQSGCILPCCMESTAFSGATWNPLGGLAYTLLLPASFLNLPVSQLHKSFLL